MSCLLGTECGSAVCSSLFKERTRKEGQWWEGLTRPMFPQPSRDLYPPPMSPAACRHGQLHTALRHLPAGAQGGEGGSGARQEDGAHRLPGKRAQQAAGCGAPRRLPCMDAMQRAGCMLPAPPMPSHHTNVQSCVCCQLIAACGRLTGCMCQCVGAAGVLRGVLRADAPEAAGTTVLLAVL